MMTGGLVTTDFTYSTNQTGFNWFLLDSGDNIKKTKVVRKGSIEDANA
jgi:hypothetical protein